MGLLQRALIHHLLQRRARGTIVNSTSSSSSVAAALSPTVARTGTSTHTCNGGHVTLTSSCAPSQTTRLVVCRHARTAAAHHDMFPCGLRISSRSCHTHSGSSSGNVNNEASATGCSENLLGCSRSVRLRESHEGGSPPTHNETHALKQTPEASPSQEEDGARERYVPLLYRKDFMETWRRPHRPLPMEELRGTALATAAPSPRAASVPPLGTESKEDRVPLGEEVSAAAMTLVGATSDEVGNDWEADWDDEYEVAMERRETSMENLNKGEQVLEEEPSALHETDDADVVRDAQGKVMYTVTPLPTTTRVILDPVQWLAEAPDAPLMKEETLFGHIAPSARSLTFTERTYHRSSEEEEEQEKECMTAAGAAVVTTGRKRSKRASMEEELNLSDLETVAAEGEAAVSDKAAPVSISEQAVVTAPLTSNAPSSSTGDRGEVQKASRSPATGGKPNASETQSLLPLKHSDHTDERSGNVRLVYNVFTRRVAKETSATIQSLSLLGIGVMDETRELALQDVNALNAFVDRLRSGHVTWPDAWSTSVTFRRLQYILSDKRVTDAAVHVRELLEKEYHRLHDRHKAGVVSGRDASSSSSDAEASNAADDKLFTIADLNEEQAKVVELVMRGYNTYIGGFAGTGKSVLLRVIRQELQNKHLLVAVTATTGVAATHIGGTTLHHRFGINMLGDCTRRKALAQYDVLIIDEISMLPRDVFEALDRQMRRANKVNLPFGGVQVILCGDFLQLGAINAQPIVNSPVFRRNFVMVKLLTTVRQAENLKFAEHLRQLRRGHVPAGLEASLNFVTNRNSGVRPSRHGGTPLLESPEALKARQTAQLRKALGADTLAQLTSSDDAAAATLVRDALSASHKSQGTDGTAAYVEASLPSASSSASPTTYVAGAVNLLPTNAEVHLVNARELARLPGDTVTFTTLVQPPSLPGRWTHTYLLRIVDPHRLDSSRLRQKLQDYIATFLRRLAPDQGWTQTELDHYLVVYPLFSDALALRVRFPNSVPDRDIFASNARLNEELDLFLKETNLGVRVREVVSEPDGLQTEQDDFTLHQYAQRASMARPVNLKVGARVLLTANLNHHLVNGSIGTVVDFCPLTPEYLPAYIRCNSARMDPVNAYAEFLLYEIGLDTPMAPVVDFGGGRVEVVPPMVFPVGGLANTHYYRMDLITIPLSLAYAFTVHKVQGLTLVGRVHLDLSRMWPCEHLLYVAMSRVRNPGQLSMSGFHPDLVRAAADCIVFDDAVPAVDDVRVLSHLVPATWQRDPSRRKEHLRRKAAERVAKKLLLTAGPSKKEKRARQGHRALQKEVEKLQEAMLGVSPSADS